MSLHHTKGLSSSIGALVVVRLVVVLIVVEVAFGVVAIVVGFAVLLAEGVEAVEVGLPTLLLQFPHLCMHFPNATFSSEQSTSLKKHSMSSVGQLSPAYNVIEIIQLSLH